MSLQTKLLSTVAALALATGPVLAQSATDPVAESGQAELSKTENPQYPPGWNEELDSAYGDIADRPVAELIGMNVITDQADTVGEVDNFVIIDDEVKAVVGVGGFLGMGEHDVALPLSELAYDGRHLVIAYTEEELRAMQEYTEELEQVAFREEDTFRTRMPSDTSEASSMTAGKALSATGDALEQGAEDVAEGMKATAEETGEAAANAVAEAADAIEDRADDMAKATDTAEGTQTDIAANGKPAGAWETQLDTTLADVADKQVSELSGYKVATVNGEVIGEVDGIAKQGGSIVVLVGVGGFLGLGEHDVALDMSRLSFDGEKFVTDGVTEEELEAMPEYDSETVERIKGEATLRNAI